MTEVERIKDFYDSIAEEYDNWYQNSVCQVEDLITFLIIEHHMNGGDTLDAGCGTGLTLDHIPIDPNAYTGIDISAGMVEKARERHPRYDFQTGNVTDIPFEDNTFHNYISTYSVFNHLDEDQLEQAIQEVMRVLNPDGRFALQVATNNGKKATQDDPRNQIYFHPINGETLADRFPCETHVRGVNYFNEGNGLYQELAMTSSSQSLKGFNYHIILGEV